MLAFWSRNPRRLSTRMLAVWSVAKGVVRIKSMRDAWPRVLYQVLPALGANNVFSASNLSFGESREKIFQQYFLCASHGYQSEGNDLV